MISSNTPTGNFGISLEQRLAPSIEQAHALADQIAQSMRVALPAVVQSFSPGPPATVTVLVATSEYATRNTGGNRITLDTTPMQLPVLEDVPIVIPSAGGWSLTMPIQAGDECLVVFSDTPLDAWLQNGTKVVNGNFIGANPVSQRRHSLSDAIAIFGLRSTPRGLTGYSQNSAQLRNDAGDVVIDLAGDQITVTAPKVHVECSNEATVHAQNTVTVTAPVIDISGSSTVTIGPHTTIDSHIFLNHVHSGVQAGLGTTGPVV